MKIYIGSDHNGYDYKQKITDFLRRSGHEVIDEGDVDKNPEDDFPQFASKVCSAVLADDGKDSFGMLICGSGQGMCMAANRFKRIRASLCWNLEEARSARNDDDSNVLCLSSKYLEMTDVEAIITTWLATPFAGAPRFKRRIKEMDELA
jgi:ribose 5-phosphate isomerase B